MDRLTITSGGMQGLDLFCKLFVDPGDLVVVESPTYTNGSATALSYGAELLEVPVDDDGMDVDALESLVAAAGRTPKAIYAIPTFQNPSGATLSLAAPAPAAGARPVLGLDGDRRRPVRAAALRRRAAADAARSWAAATRWCSRSGRSRRSSRPGLRVGWVDTAPELQPLLINAKQAMDTCTNLPAQRLLAGFLRGGHLDGHLVDAAGRVPPPQGGDARRR